MNILVTGATGLVGAEVTDRLAARGHAVLALVHRATDIVANTGRIVRTTEFTGRFVAGEVTCLAADVTRPALGLPEDRLDSVLSGLDRIVHAAAITDFGRRQDIYEAVNVQGTANVLELARQGGIPLVHLSTAYVCGEQDGPFSEDQLDLGQRFANGYEESKVRAERLVRAAGLPVAVVRPSIVVGSERTGRIRTFKNIYVMLRLTTAGALVSLPGRYDASLDLVAVDRVADLVVEVASRFGEAEGRTFHAIGASPVTLRELSDLLAEHPSLRVPRFVPPDAFQSDALPPSQHRLYERVGSLYEPYLRRRVCFDDMGTRAFSRARPTVSGRAHMRRLLEHCLRVGYLGVRQPRRLVPVVAR